MEQSPTIGRIVHYVAPGSADGTYPPTHRAAIITEIPPPVLGDPIEVDLAVLNPTGIHFIQYVPYNEAGDRYSWHWPERE